VLEIKTEQCPNPVATLKVTAGTENVKKKSKFFRFQRYYISLACLLMN
jgi:hypothetical protein